MSLMDSESICPRGESTPSRRRKKRQKEEIFLPLLSSRAAVLLDMLLWVSNLSSVHAGEPVGHKWELRHLDLS